MAFIQAKAIKVYYTKGDRKPYDVNGKPLSYLGQENIGANIATQVRFYLGEELGESITPIVVTKRADGDRHFDILEEGTDTEVTPNQKYYYVDLSNWYAEKVGKLTLALKVYSGTVTIEDDEITASTGRIVVSDIFHIDVAYAPDASDLVPPFDPDYYEELLEALANKVERQEVIQVVNTLPSVTTDDNGKWFLVRQTNGGRLYRVLGGVAVEVETEMGQLKLTPTGNGEVTTNTGQVAWEEENGTAKLGLYNDVTLHLGEDVMYYAKASGAIVKGDVVQFAGYQGDHAIIKKAVPSEINVQPKLIMGIAKQDIANNEFGYVLAFGKLESVDTKGYTNGTLIWFDSASGTGQWTNVVPTAPNAKVLLAVVVKQESAGLANNGVILVRPTFEPKLSELQDVVINSLQDYDVLRYDASIQAFTNDNSLTTAEANITQLQTDVIGLDNTKADITYVDSQDDDLSDRITLIETTGGIDFIKVANFASLPSSGDARNHRLFMTIDTKQLWEWDGSQWNESSPTDLTDITVSANSGEIALTIIGDSTRDESIVRINDGLNNIVANMDGLGNLTLEKDLFVEGNLTVNGTTTTVNTETVAIEDNVIVINSNQTGTPSPTLKGGIEVERGSETNYQFVFDESDDRFKVGQVGSLQTVATRQDDVNMVASGVPFYNDTEKRFDTSSNLKVNASGQLVDTTIRNSAVGVVPLIVNGVASTSANIQQWQVNGSTVALIYNNGNIGTNGAIRNINDVARSSVELSNEGVSIGRNIGDANHALRVNQNHASSTGNIANFQFAGANKLEITKDGDIFRNGIRFLSTPTTDSIVLGNGITSSLTGQNNILFGSNILISGTSSAQNVAIGGDALRNGTTATSIVAVGRNAGRSVTTSTTSVFVGRDAGNNASQLVSATNSTALGNESYTDKSNQMVFGNASVSEFKFDRNASAEVLLPRITASTTSIASFERTTTETNTSASVFSVKRTTTGDMADGFGGGFLFQIRDNANTDNIVSVIRGLRSGADNSGRLTLETANAGTLTEKMTILPNGNVGIGTTAPNRLLSLVKNVADFTPSILVSNTNANSGSLSSVKFLNGTDTTGLDVGKHSSGFATPDMAFVFQQKNAPLQFGTNNIERMRILANGNVGIGTTAPNRILSVSGNGEAIPLQINNISTTAGQLALIRAVVSSDNANTASSIDIGAIRTASSNADFIIRTDNTEKFRILNNGNVGIGTNAPAVPLSVVTQTNINGIQIRRNSTTTNEFASLGFRVVDSDGEANSAEIQAVRTNRAVSADTDLRFLTRSNVTTTEKMRIRDDGFVGIGTTTPSVRLEVNGLFNADGTPSNEQTGDYTLVLADKGKVLRVNSSSNRTITIPLNSSVAFPIDTEIALIRYGSGTVSISPTSGVTLNSISSNRKVKDQYGSCALKKIGTDEWVLVGSLEA